MKTITENSLARRIDRRLKRENGSRLCRTTNRELGPYYIVDGHLGNVAAWGIDDLEDLGRELGVLKENETLAG